MKNFGQQLDITKNIKMIEILKCQILNGVADLHTSLINSIEQTERTEIFADLTILIYILANRLGITPDELKLKINKKLKIGVLDQDNDYIEDIKGLIRYFNNN